MRAQSAVPFAELKAKVTAGMPKTRMVVEAWQQGGGDVPASW